MNTVIYLEELGRHPDRQMHAGVSAFARKAGWDVQSVPNVHTKAQLSNLVKIWDPLGFIAHSGFVTRHSPFFCGKPTVVIGRPKHGKGAGVSCVFVPATAMAELAARELLPLHLRDYAYVSEAKPSTWDKARLAAFKSVMALHGKSVNVFDATRFRTDETSLVSSLADWLKGLEGPVGVFAASDIAAANAASACRRAGLSMPDDVAVVGVGNDTTLCESAPCSLTSIDLGFFDIGYAAAESLSSLISGENSSSERMLRPKGLVRRASTRRLLRPDKAITDMMERIRREACNGLSAKDAANSLDCTRRSVGSRFRAATGRSILEEIRRVRLEAAKELLKKETADISFIASHCGYRSLSAFSMFFRTETGFSPREWRAKSPTTQAETSPPRERCQCSVRQNSAASQTSDSMM